MSEKGSFLTTMANVFQEVRRSANIKITAFGNELPHDIKQEYEIASYSQHLTPNSENSSIEETTILLLVGIINLNQLKYIESILPKMKNLKGVLHIEGPSLKLLKENSYFLPKNLEECFYSYKKYSKYPLDFNELIDILDDMVSKKAKNVSV